MGGGVALFDFDDDGWLDIYFVNGCALPFDRQSRPRPNKLYRNRGDGTFEDVTERAGVGGQGYGMGCAVGDFDNDGHDDLFVTGLNQTVLYRNRGDGTFADVTAQAGVASSRWTTAAGFGDLDGDGDLDLVVVTYVEADPEDVVECRDKSGRLIHCQPERFPAQLDHLFRNNGDGTFSDVSREAGIEVPEGRGLGLAIADLDGDGRLDLFVANDGTANFLFRNRGGLRFEEVGLTAGVAYDAMGQPTASMGVVAEDLNDDGRIDLFHTNFINQSSTLRWNLGGCLFTDATLAANLAAPSRSQTGFGTVALDVDNDGTLELFVANGHTDDQPWFNTPMAQTPQLFLGRDHGRFELASPEGSPYLARPVVGRGVAAGDLDNDGRVDLVVVHRDAPAALLHNDTRGGHWLGLRLRGTRSGRSPDRGARDLPGRRPIPSALADQRDQLPVLERPEALVRAGVSREGRAPGSALALRDGSDLVRCRGRSHPRHPGRRTTTAQVRCRRTGRAIELRRPIRVYFNSSRRRRRRSRTGCMASTRLRSRTSPGSSRSLYSSSRPVSLVADVDEIVFGHGDQGTSPRGRPATIRIKGIGFRQLGDDPIGGDRSPSREG